MRNNDEILFKFAHFRSQCWLFENTLLRKWACISKIVQIWYFVGEDEVKKTPPCAHGSNVKAF